MPRLKSPDPLLGTSRAARFLGVHRSTLNSWRLRGEIAPTEIVRGPKGILYKFSVEDLSRFKERIDYVD